MFFLLFFFFQEEQREEVKEWVLAVSMDQRVEQTLSLDERNTYEASLTSPESDVVCLPCVVTGTSLSLVHSFLCIFLLSFA